MLLYLLFVALVNTNSEIIDLTDEISIHWGIGETVMNISVGCTSNINWVGIGWKKTSEGGGMAGADMVLFEGDKATDMYATSNSMPDIDTQQDILYNGMYEYDGRDWYVCQKANPTNDKQDVKIDSGEYWLLYAWGTGDYSDHGKNAGMIKVNFLEQQGYFPDQNDDSQQEISLDNSKNGDTDEDSSSLLLIASYVIALLV